MAKRVAWTVLGVLALSASTSACKFFEDGSARLDDGTSVCLVPDMGCGEPQVELGPPPIPTTMTPPVVSEPERWEFYTDHDGCVAFVADHVELSSEFFPNYETGEGLCRVTDPTWELIDVVLEGDWQDNHGWRPIG